MANLRTYRAKRDFGKTPEPRGDSGRGKGNHYVIQKHAATRLHYDLRLELDGVMLSWAVTKGPSLVPGEKRLAIHVEDHPIEYNKFEGTIPKDEYGGGTVMIWDRGRWFPEGDPHRGMKKGHLDFRLEGEKLEGHWDLVRMKPRPGERQEPWLLIKASDEFARQASDPDVLDEMPNSVATGRRMEDIAADKKKVWHSKPKASQPSRAAAKLQSVAPRDPSGPRARSSHKKPTAKSAATSKDVDLGGIPGVRKTRLPPFIAPCLATLSSAAPDSSDWLHEIKFDGYRIQARIGGAAVSLKTRTGLDWTKKFPTVAQSLDALTGHEAILDGEIVSGDENGVSDFSGLQDDLKTGRQDRLAYYVFDLLHLDGYDLTGAALIDRKRVLRDLLADLPQTGVIRLSDHFEADGATMLKHACQMNLEGIVSKRRDAPYRSGRGTDWLKTKCSNSQELVVAGFGPSDVSPKRVRALVLGYYDKDLLQYAGRVGTGFSDAMRDDFWRKLEALRIDKSPFGQVPEEERGRPVRWVDPRMVVEVEFRGWTGSGRVRQASFKGVREDKPAKQVVREVGQMPGGIKNKPAELRQKTPTKTITNRSHGSQSITVAGITLTHPDRVYWPDAGVTKRILAEYYTQVWDWIRPHVTGRVIALLRCPEGATSQCFFQKHASAGIDEKHLHLVKEPDGDKSIAIDRLDGLIALVQAGVLEIHTRGSTIDHLEEANRLVFDLDPGPGVDWAGVLAAAREVRQRLHDLKLESFVKTTGGKGLHVVLPIRFTPWDEAKDFCRWIAEQMTADSPDRFTATLKKSQREHRIFIDYLRNSREATAIAPYSTRARPGATVSTPLSWDDLGSQKSPNAFTVENLPKRLSRMRKDPWADIDRLKQRLPALDNRKIHAGRKPVKSRAS